MRRSSIFGFVDTNEIGLSYLPLLSVLIGFMLFQRHRFYYVFLFFGGITAVLTNGRYIMIAFVLLTIQILIFQKVKIQGFFKYAILITIVGFLLIRLLFALGYNFQEWYSARLLAEGSLEETTRYKAIGTFLKFFPENVMFGFGGATEEITEASHDVGSSQIHVGYLAGLVYYGIVGCFFLFGFWFLLAKELYKRAKEINYWGSFFAFLVFLWANVTLVTFHIFFYGIIFALVFDKYFFDKYQEQIKSQTL